MIKTFIKTLIVLNLLTLSTASLGDEYKDNKYNDLSQSDFLKFAHDLYKENRKQRKEKVKLKKTNEFNDSNICVGCNEIKNLVFQVNKSLYHLSNKLEKDNPKQKSLEHVEALDAMYHYTMETNSLGENKCYKSKQGFENSFLDLSYGEFNEDESEVIFSNMVPLSSLEAIHLRDGKKKTYFYRASAPNRDVVVKVQIDDLDNAKVTYYKMEFTPLLAKGLENEKELIQLEKNIKLKKKSDERWGSWFESDADSKTDYFKYGAGFEIEHDDYLPKRLTLIQGESLTPLTEYLSLKTNSEISSKKLRSNISLTDTLGDEYLEIELKSSKAELKIPTKIDIFSTGYKLKTSISANTDMEQSIDFEILGSLKNRNKIEIMSTDRGMAYSVENFHKIDKKQSVSFKFTKDREEGSSAYIRYQLNF